MKVVGLTGGVGAGKSTLLGYMHAHWGAMVLELDKVAARLQKRGESCYQPMLELLGTQVLQADGEFDRAKVARRVFADARCLTALNGIVHPRVKEYVREQIRQAQGTPLVVLEAALLLEDHYDALCDEIWYVFAPEEVRIRRLMESRGYTEEKCRAIMEAQGSDAFFKGAADRVIDNGGADPALAFAQIDIALDELLGRDGQKK